jgi:hypothetical protein
MLGINMPGNSNLGFLISTGVRFTNERLSVRRYLDSYILKSENLSLRFSFGLSWIPAGVYPDENRGRNDKPTNTLSFPCLCAEALQRTGVETGIQSRKISNIFG